MATSICLESSNIESTSTPKTAVLTVDGLARVTAENSILGASEPDKDDSCRGSATAL